MRITRFFFLLFALVVTAMAQPASRRPPARDEVIYFVDRIVDAQEKDGALVLIYRTWSNEAAPALPAMPTSRAVRKVYRAIDGQVLLADITEGKVIPATAEQYEFP